MRDSASVRSLLAVRHPPLQHWHHAHRGRAVESTPGDRPSRAGEPCAGRRGGAGVAVDRVARPERNASSGGRDAGARRASGRATRVRAESCRAGEAPHGGRGARLRRHRGRRRSPVASSGGRRRRRVSAARCCWSSTPTAIPSSRRATSARSPTAGSTGSCSHATSITKSNAPTGVGDIPVVLIGAIPASGWVVPAVAPDEHALAEAATAHLLAAGHRRLAFITAMGDTPVTRGRHAGFRSAIEWAGIYDRHAVVERTSPDAAGGRRMGRRLLDQPPSERPTGDRLLQRPGRHGCLPGSRGCGARGASRLLGRRRRRSRGHFGSARPRPHDHGAAASRDGSSSDGRAARAHRGCSAADVAGPVLLAGELVERRSVAPPRRLMGWLNRR